MKRAKDSGEQKEQGKGIGGVEMFIETIFPFTAHSLRTRTKGCHDVGYRIVSRMQIDS